MHHPQAGWDLQKYSLIIRKGLCESISDASSIPDSSQPLQVFQWLPMLDLLRVWQEALWMHTGKWIEADFTSSLELSACARGRVQGT